MLNETIVKQVKNVEKSKEVNETRRRRRKKKLKTKKNKTDLQFPKAIRQDQDKNQYEV